MTEKCSSTTSNSYASSFIMERSAKAGPHELLLYPFFMSRLNSIKGKVVLDAGCGHGVLAERLSVLDPERIIALDHNESLLSVLEQKAIQRIQTLNADLSHSIPLSDCCVDIIVCSQVLIHLNDKEFMQALNEFERVLRPGGFILAAVTHFEWATSMYGAQEEEEGVIWANRERDGSVYKEWFRSESVYQQAFTHAGLIVSLNTICVPDDGRLESRYKEKAGLPIFYGIIASKSIDRALSHPS